VEGTGIAGGAKEPDGGNAMSKPEDFFKPLIELYGGDVKAFGHGTVEGTFKRYWAATQVCPLVGLDVIDVGCAYGGLVPFVIGAGVRSYLGVDAVAEFTAEASKRWSNTGDRAKVNFFQGDFDSLAVAVSFDVVFALGVGTLNESLDVYEQRMKKAFLMARQAVVFSLPMDSGPPNDWLLHSACRLTHRVVMLRNYWLPDQMVYLYKVGNDKK